MGLPFFLQGTKKDQYIRLKHEPLNDATIFPPTALQFIFALFRKKDLSTYAILFPRMDC
jgi:hypothetical protein